ncbi:hypothetical protein D8674_017643 [Pyrus ussuriensis x Pyrus communis]|uniref:Uncharacterized protein n=1 Tax=Pyrus ussuriensis x Pyrus communis TaxID=2448454 RepID=A0A5N5HHA6_9ROSA|nr:hypothetical protein D8674_017643 [Pyrus ussuriensis x Pyrus communis]
MRTRSSRIPWRVGSKKRKLRLSLVRSSKAAKSSVERSLLELQTIIPGCGAINRKPEIMFKEIFNYICLLEAKVDILRILASSFGV